MKLLFAALAALLICGHTAAVMAQGGGDTARGLTFATEVCAECHSIGKEDQPSTHPDAPPFKAIANSPGMSWIALNVALRTPHEVMPNLVISDQERADVAEYILSLKD